MAFAYKRTITIDNTKVSASLSNYPVMVKLTTSNFDFTKVRSDGLDIAFYDTSDTLLDFETEYFEDSTLGVFHVRIPSVSSSVDTTFIMKYGDSKQSTDLSNKTGVWDSNFVMVQHMGTSLLDSTSNGNNGTNNGTTIVDGLNGKARSFDGNDYINCGDIDLTNLTISYFIKGYTNSNIHVSKRNNSSYSFEMGLDYEYPMLRINSNSYVATSSNGLSSSIYTQLVGTFNGSNIKIWQNGVLEATTNYTTAINQTDADVNIGRRGYIGAEEYTVGTIDEVRISNITRSNAWILADDYNLRLNTLLSISGQSDINIGFNAVNIGGVWKSTVETKVNIGGVWKKATAVFTNINGIWKEDVN